MTEAPIIPRRRRTASKAESGFSKQRTIRVKGESIAMPSPGGNPLEPLMPIVDWFNVVDGFSLFTHRNTLPRWTFLVLGLLLVALL